MKAPNLKGFTKTQKTIIIALSLRDDIKSSYNIERNNRALPVAFRDMERKGLIIREGDFARLNKKKFDVILGEGMIDKFIQQIQSAPNLDKIKTDPKIMVLKNSTIEDLFNKATEISEFIKKKTK